MNRRPEGLVQSVQTRLVGHAKAIGVDPNLVLTRFAEDRIVATTTLQFVIDPEELEAVRAAAEEMGVTISEFVRQTILEACQKAASGDPDRKLAAIRAAVRHAYPTFDIDQMLGEIENGI